MKGKIISMLSSLLNEGSKTEKIKWSEDIIIESVDEFVEEDCFYELLPTKEILKIIKESEISEVGQLC